MLKVSNITKSCNMIDDLSKFDVSRVIFSDTQSDDEFTISIKYMYEDGVGPLIISTRFVPIYLDVVCYSTSGPKFTLLEIDVDTVQDQQLIDFNNQLYYALLTYMHDNWKRWDTCKPIYRSGRPDVGNDVCPIGYKYPLAICAHPLEYDRYNNSLRLINTVIGICTCKSKYDHNRSHELLCEPTIFVSPTGRVSENGKNLDYHHNIDVIKSCNIVGSCTIVYDKYIVSDKLREITKFVTEVIVSDVRPKGRALCNLSGIEQERCRVIRTGEDIVETTSEICDALSK